MTPLRAAGEDEGALEAGGTDNVTAVVVHVRAAGI